jgi:hypothetical protein
LDFRIIATLLLILMTALPASAEISGVAVVNDGNVAWAAAGALGGTLSADQTANTNYGTSASQDVEATGTQAFASTGAINSEGYAATNVAVVQDGTLLGYQSSSTSEDAVSTDQGITVQGESGYVEATVSDPQGGSGSTVAEMENGELATARVPQITRDTSDLASTSAPYPQMRVEQRALQLAQKAHQPLLRLRWRTERLGTPSRRPSRLRDHLAPGRTPT